MCWAMMVGTRAWLWHSQRRPGFRVVSGGAADKAGIRAGDVITAVAGTGTPTTSALAEGERYAHLVGGARMAARPQDGVVDANLRSFAVPNLYITDGSVLPTQGSANPALTIMALAARAADHLTQRRGRLSR